MTAKEIIPAVAAVEEITATVQNNVQEFVKTGHEQAKKKLEEVVSVAKEQTEKLQEQVTKGYEDFATFSKGNVEAVVASSTVATKGAEEISKAYAALIKSCFEKYVAAGKAMMTAKSLDEIVTLSNDFAKTSYETMLAETGKLQEMSVQVANEALAPISARFNVAVEKFAKPLAA